MIGIQLLVVLGVLILLGQIIALAIGATAIGGIFVFDLPISMIGQTLYGSLDNETWAAIPLYLMMGSLLVRSGIASDMFRAINVWTRAIAGGLGVATIGTSAVFAAVSGTSIGTVAAMARVTVPEMTSRGYRKSFAYGTLCSASTLGILIPPSVPLILYGMVTEVSILKLFVAGILPGLMVALMFSLYCYMNVRLFQSNTVDQRAPFREKLQESARGVWGFLLIVLVLGGLYSGLLTITESAGFGAVLALLISIFVYRTFSWKGLFDALLETVRSTCMILLIVAFASLFGSVINMLHIPQALTDAIVAFDLHPWLVVLFFSLILFLMGQFLDVPSVMLISLPIMHPVIVELGFDPVWFAILVVMNMEVATITPPVGLNLYVLKGAIPEAKLSEIVSGSLPFLGLIILAMILVCLFPGLATWLPSLL